MGNQAFSRLDYQKAWEAYQKARALGVHDAVMTYRLMILEEMLDKPGKEKESPLRVQAYRLLEIAYKRDPNRPVLYFYLAQFRESLRGNSEAKSRLYAEAIRKFETQKFGPLSAEDYEKIGRMYLFMGLTAKAESIFLKAQELDPNNALSKFYLGKLYRQTGRERAALKQFESFLKLVPRDTEGHILLGESAYGVGDFDRARKAFRTANALDSINSEARAGLLLTERTLARRNQLQKQAGEIIWDVGLRSRIRPLTLTEDNLDFDNDALGPPFVGLDGNLSFTSGEGDRFEIFSLSAEGLHLKKRAASSSGFSSQLGSPNLYLVALGVGPGREIGAYDDLNGTFRNIYRGHCKEPNYSVKARMIVCLTPRGVLLIDSVSENVSTLYRETGARYPRFSPDGKKVVLTVGDELVLLDLAGQVVQRHRLPGEKEAVTYPDVSPDGRWILSGSQGLLLTSVKDKLSLSLSHPTLQNGRRAIFSADGGSVVFERDGQLFHLDLPKPVGSFFTFQRAMAMIRKKRFGTAVRLLNEQKSRDQNLPGYSLLLGQAYMGLNFNEKAEEAARRAAQLDHKDWRPQLLLGRLMALRGAFNKSFRYFDQAVELSPGRFEGYLERARVRLRLGNVEAAVTDYRKAIENLGPNPGPSGESTVLGLFNLYVDAKRVNDALLLLLDHANRLSPNAVDMVRTNSRYRLVRKDPRFSEVIGPVRPVPARNESSQPGLAPVVPDPDVFPTETNPSIPPSEQNIKKSGKIRARPTVPRLVSVAGKGLQFPGADPKLDGKGPWVLSGVLFSFDRATINPRFHSILDRAVEVLKKNPALFVEIQGHTDGRGPEDYNLRLSEKRALAVLRYLVEKGVRRDRLSVKGYGELSPLESNATKAGRARNRRVEIRVIRTGVFAAR